MNKSSIGIIGMGWVGSSVAISILSQGICKELLLNDLNMDLAEGEAMDMNHGSSFFPTATIRAAQIEDMIDCSAIVITAGKGGTPGQSRLELLSDNITITRRISERLKGFKGILIVVSNPVDVLTFYYQKFTGLPSTRVIGTGTMLDTARLREYISQKIHIDPKSIHANIVGEHGDSEVALWSRAMVGTIPLRKWNGWQLDYEFEIGEKVRTAAYEIIKRKGATNHAIGLVTATLLKWILRGDRRMVNVSSVIDGPYNLNEIAFSLPTVIGENGIEEVLQVEVSDTELEKIYNSANVIRKAIQPHLKNT